jgi:predicted HAD superfamily Cof-like phosphohydrolase
MSGSTEQKNSSSPIKEDFDQEFSGPVTVIDGGAIMTKEVRIPGGRLRVYEGVFDPVRDIEEFHKKFGIAYEGKPRALIGELGKFRRDFNLEEAQEYSDASVALERFLERGEGPDDTFITSMLELQLDALVDLVYVALGAAHLQGFKFREAWERVHGANMRKVRCERKEDSKRGTTFDVIKPPGWEPPDHTDLVEDHAHRTSNDG